MLYVVKPKNSAYKGDTSTLQGYKGDTSTFQGYKGDTTFN